MQVEEKQPVLAEVSEEKPVLAEEKEEKLELVRSGDGVRWATSWRVWREPWAKEASPTRRLGEMRRMRLELDNHLGVSMSTIQL